MQTTLPQPWALPDHSLPPPQPSYQWRWLQALGQPYGAAAMGSARASLAVCVCVCLQITSYGFRCEFCHIPFHQATAQVERNRKADRATKQESRRFPDQLQAGRAGRDSRTTEDRVSRARGILLMNEVACTSCCGEVWKFKAKLSFRKKNPQKMHFCCIKMTNQNPNLPRLWHNHLSVIIVFNEDV